MSQLVDQDGGGTARETRLDIKLLEDDAAVIDLPPRKNLESEEERARVVSTVGLDDPYDDVASVFAFESRRLEHRIGLADARRRTEEDGELPARGSSSSSLTRASKASASGRSDIFEDPSPVLCFAASTPPQIVPA